MSFEDAFNEIAEDFGIEGIPDLQTGKMPSPEETSGPLLNAIESLPAEFSQFKKAAFMAQGSIYDQIKGAKDVIATGLGIALPNAAPLINLASTAFDLTMGLAGKIVERNIAEGMNERCRQLTKALRSNLAPNDRMILMGNDVSLPSYTDCRSAINPRRRTVVTPQTRPAPWRSQTVPMYFPFNDTWDVVQRGYKEPTGNCKSGFAVAFCGNGRYNKKAPGAGGSRCHGNADFTALLYPWWCGNGPPRPAPAIDWNDGEFYYDPNAMLMGYQQALLTNPALNARVPVEGALNMQAALLTFLEDRMVIEDAAGRVFTADELTVPLMNAAEQCRMFVEARQSMMKTGEFQQAVELLRNDPYLDPLLQQAVGVAPKKPKRIRDRIRDGEVPEGPMTKLAPSPPARKPSPGGGSKGSSALPIVLGVGIIGAAIVLGKKKR